MLSILIVTPAPRRSRKGNRITAERWASLLTDLGCRVRIAEAYEGQPCDLLIALHARKSARSIARFRKAEPNKSIVLALTGTDIYGQMPLGSHTRKSLELATRIVLLQPHAIARVPPQWRRKVRVIYQSAVPPRRTLPPKQDVFEIAVVGHMRPVKDPFRAALAARQLPASSRIEIVQIGSALSPAMALRAKREMAFNPRYRWLGELSYERTKQRLARCRLLVVSSKLEGGANVVSEAIVANVPVISSRISGSIGLLGEDYPGFFQVGDTRELTQLLLLAENEPAYLDQLQQRCLELRPLFSPESERESWRELMVELGKRDLRY